VVEAVGEGVTGFREGDRVGTFSGPLGAYATHRAVDSDRVVKLPDSLGFEEARGGDAERLHRGDADRALRPG
jgi:NADPH2:quinone reductase